MKALILFSLFISSTFAFTGKVIRYKGDVTINKNQLNKSTIVRDGDIIEAKGKSSFVQVKMDSGSIFLVRDGSLKVVAKDKKNNGVNLTYGLIYIFHQKTKDNDFKVWTKSGSLGVRGTKFLVMESSKDTYLCVCTGIVSAKNDKMSVNVKAGQDLHLTKSNTLQTEDAAQRMWDMAKEGFDLMGYPL